MRHSADDEGWIDAVGAPEVSRRQHVVREEHHTDY